MGASCPPQNIPQVCQKMEDGGLEVFSVSIASMLVPTPGGQSLVPQANIMGRIPRTAAKCPMEIEAEAAAKSNIITLHKG